MNREGFSVILVYSTSHALRAEKILKEADITCKLIPVPRQLSSDCGSCIRVLQHDSKRAYQLLQSAQIGVDGLYEI